MTENAKISTGLSITFASGFLAEVVDLTLPNMSRVAIDSSHMLTDTARTFIPGKLYDPGELSCDIHYDPGEDPPISDDKETITITFDDGEILQGQGFMTGYAPKAPLEDKMVATVTIKFSGIISQYQDS